MGISIKFSPFWNPEISLADLETFTQRVKFYSLIW